MERTTVSTADRGSIRIGCSGWVYKHWRGFFYPEGLAQKRWFQHYAADPQAAPDAASLRAMAAAGAGFFVAKPYSPTPTIDTSVPNMIIPISGCRHLDSPSP